MTVSALSISASVDRVRGDDVLMVYDGVSGVSFSRTIARWWTGWPTS
jgi:hypothetical protein